ncbi:hypothetical protein DES43_12353 [Aquamicrobium defluvii]|uniref:Uncharacterized protein n=1 Tax=Aquamicrobium defluvii TaxID=69279 RepID=A0A4R6YCB8_9HYPH|nr:hypothetical protein DES43_12353 [Aquamicrobium defluvii]
MHTSRVPGNAARKGIDMAGRAARITTYHSPRPADLRRR